MLICETLKAGRVGEFLFTFTPGSFLSENINEETGGDISHVAIITGPNQVAEALAQGFVHQPLMPRLDPNNREVLCFIRRPIGLTKAAATAMKEICESWIGTPYDWTAYAGFVFTDAETRGVDPNWAEDNEKLFCSEAGAALLRQVEPLLSQPLPSELKNLHPSFMTPWDLFNIPGLWIPGCFMRHLSK